MSNPETSAPEGGAPKEVPAASTEFSITVRTLPGESIAATVGRLSTALMERDATILMLMSNGPLAPKAAPIRALA